MENKKEGMCEIELEDGSITRVSDKHSVYAGVYSTILNPSEFNIMSLPLSCSGESCPNNSEILVSCNFKSPASTLISQMPKCSLDKNGSSVKCLSLVINNLCSDNANLNTSPFLIDFGVNLTSCPNLDRNEISPLCTFSSNKNFILCNCSYSFSGSELGGEIQCGHDVAFGKGRVCFEDIFDSISCLKHLNDYINHNSSALESGLPVADFTVSNNEIIDIFSHNSDNGWGIYKGYELTIFGGSGGGFLGGFKGLQVMEISNLGRRQVTQTSGSLGDKDFLRKKGLIGLNDGFTRGFTRGGVRVNEEGRGENGDGFKHFHEWAKLTENGEEDNNKTDKGVFVQ